MYDEVLSSLFWGVVNAKGIPGVKNHLGELKGSQSETGSRKNNQACAVRVRNTRVDLGGVRKKMERGNDQAHVPNKLLLMFWL